MLHRRRWIMAGVIIAIVSLGLSGVEAQSAGPNIQATAPIAMAGGTIRFTGGGFANGERVATWATDPNQTVWSGPYFYAARADGTVELSFDVPGDAVSGRWALTAYGDRSKTPAVALFDVQNANPRDTEPPSTVEPAAGPPGTEFRFNIYGFRGEESVSYWITGPDGKVFAAYPNKKTADRNGKVALPWIAPTDAARGTWVLTVQGLKSGRAKAVRFDVR